MTRAQQTISVGLFVAALYLSILTRTLPIPMPSIVYAEILPVLPLWALIAFGCYLLSSMGWSLLTFNDVPEAHAKLMKEIDVARKELRTLGVDVD